MIYYVFFILTFSLWVNIKAEDVIFTKGSFKKMAFPSGSCMPNISSEIENVKNKIECGSRCLALTFCSAFFYEDNKKRCRLADMSFGCNNQLNKSNDYGYIKQGKAF